MFVPGCGSSPTSPEEISQTLTESVETRSIPFHYSPGDSVDSEWQQSFHDWATAQLGVQLSGKLQYFKYTGRAQMGSVTGQVTNGWADPPRSTVHSIWPSDGHEALHVYTALLGRPSDFFNEGIAVALNTGPDDGMSGPRWNGIHVHAHVAMLRRTQRFVPLSQLLTTNDFRDIDDWVSYGEAGSFLFWLVETYSLESMIQFFRTGARDASRGAIEVSMRASWGLTLVDAERLWLQTVDGWS